MKKTLTISAILYTLGALSLNAEIVTWDGVTCDPGNFTVTGAVTSYKHKSSVGAPLPNDTADYNLCGPSSASNTLAWWLDRVEANGALIMPEDIKRGYDVWEEVRTLVPNNAMYPGWMMQFWLTGYMYANHEQWLTPKGQEFKGYFSHLLGGDYKFDGSDRPANCLTSAISSDGIRGTYQDASQQLVQGMKEGWAYVLDTGNHYMTVYGVKTDENGLITEIYYSDNNDSNSRKGLLKTATLYPSVTQRGDKTYGDNIAASGLGYPNITNFFGIRSKGLEFDTYDMTMTGEDGEEDLFSHYLNLTIDGHSGYQLKYDLRNALDADSPVNALNEQQERIATGNISLKSGKLSLVACDEARKELDGGGKTSGRISFESKEGATRTLSVQHTDTIAAEIHLNAADGNTLEVTGDNTATFRKLTGTGNLVKTGTGTAEVTEEVSLKGSIDVQSGKFILGVNATLSAETVLTVAKDAHMESTADKPVTLSISSGIHTNDGEMKLTTTLTGGTLKGSGTFGAVTVDGGKLVVGNSPGHQEYEGALTLNSGSIEFAVSGFTANDGSNTGWGSGTYSTINMNGNDLVIGDDGQILIALGQDALTSMGGEFALALVTGLSDNTTLDLAKMAQNTQFVLADESGAQNSRAAVGPQQFSYQMSNGVLMLTSGTGADSGNANVPEPATGTLSLLALAGLMARRRRK